MSLCAYDSHKNCLLDLPHSSCWLRSLRIEEPQGTAQLHLWCPPGHESRRELCPPPHTLRLRVQKCGKVYLFPPNIPDL